MILRRLAHTFLWGIILAVEVELLADKSCNDGQILIRDACYEPQFERPTTYENAKEICEEGAGQVALVSDPKLKNLLTRIALKHQYENYWIQRENANPGECHSMKYANEFEVGEMHCNNGLFYICEFNSKMDKSLEYENRYFVLSEERKKFSDAQKVCVELGGKIAEIYGVDDHIFLTEQLNKDITWDRLSSWQLESLQFGSTHNLWAGASFDEEAGTWTSAAGTPVATLKFISKSEKFGNCMTFNRKSFTISHCDEYNYFVCQFPAYEEAIQQVSMENSSSSYYNILDAFLILISIYASSIFIYIVIREEAMASEKPEHNGQRVIYILVAFVYGILQWFRK